MLVPRRKQADLLMEIAKRGGSQSVNRHYQPPLRVYNALIKRGNLRVTRSGLPSCRTTSVVLTEAGRAETYALARHYGLTAQGLEARYAMTPAY